MWLLRLFRGLLSGAALFTLLTTNSSAQSPEWTFLSDGADLGAWQLPTEQWVVAGSVAVDPKNPKRLVYEPGKGILVNGLKGKTHDLLSRQFFGDVDLHAEFLIPRGSNSGVKLQGLYEIQIFDSWGKKTPTASDCGGIYPRAERLPIYHHIDKGIPPLANACKPAGEWQTLEIVFQAPRFDAHGTKTANARFVKVILNDKLIHDNVEVKTPTGHAWHEKEVSQGPLLLQGDHGPVAFRNLKVRAR
jgi:hypothetical protein